MADHLVINATMLNSTQLAGLGVYTQSLLNELLPLAYEDSAFARVTLIGGADYLHRTIDKRLIAEAEGVPMEMMRPVSERDVMRQLRAQQEQQAQEQQQFAQGAEMAGKLLPGVAALQESEGAKGQISAL